MSIRKREGLGPGVDPHFDARVGQAALSSDRNPQELHVASGYIELVDERPWDYLRAIIEILYEQPPQDTGPLYRISAMLGLHSSPLAWTRISKLGYLTTDSGTGVALPLHDFNPDKSSSGWAARSSADLAATLERLGTITGGRLPSASKIGLTVSFEFGLIAAALQPVIVPGRVRRLLGFLYPRRRSQVQQSLFGGISPRLGPIAQPMGRGIGARRYAAQALGASGSASLQLQRSMRELKTGNLSSAGAAPVTDLDYGITETGSGVIVGIVDFGCDLAHPSFSRNGFADRTRILALWDQNPGPEGLAAGAQAPAADEPSVVVGGQSCRFGYGRVFTRARIEAALRNWQQHEPADPDAPYRLLGYHPFDHHYTAKRPGEAGGPDAPHGLHVMEIAAGGRRSGCPQGATPQPTVRGVAPDADIVFVQVRLHAQLDGRKALDVNDVIDAVAYVFHLAESQGKPCVVNLSLNTMSGPHDGDGYFERRLSALLTSGSAGAASKGRAVVVAAGNLPEMAVRSRCWQHLEDLVPADGRFEFFWRIAAGDTTRNSVEIWYDAKDWWLQVTLVAPSGEPLGTILPGGAAEILDDGTARGSIVGSRPMLQIRDNRELAGSAPDDEDRVPGRHVILLQIDPDGAGTAEWKIVLEAAAGGSAPAQDAASLQFHAWLERDDEGQSGLQRVRGQTFVDPRDENSTVGTLSCSQDAIVVGAYTTVAAVPGRWGLSGCGPSRLGDIEKPDLSAPGQSILLLRSAANAAAGPCAKPSGTSMAAPFVTGTIACFYEAWKEAPLAKVREALVSTARRDPPDGQAGWDRELGNGRLNPVAAVASIKDLADQAGGG